MIIHPLALHPAALTILARWYFDEWGREAGLTLEDEEAKLAKALQADDLPLVLIAIDEGEIVGSIQVKEREMPQFPDLVHWIGGVYVPARHRGKGIGRRLIEEAVTAAQRMGIEAVHLQTEDMSGGLYRQMGWVPLHRATNHGVEVLVMVREFPPRDAIKVDLLADHPAAVHQLATWFEREWPSYYGPDGPGNAQRDLASFASRDRLPIGVVALIDGVPCGVAALKPDSIASHSHLSPWAAAGLVNASLRGKGIGARLLEALEQEARRLDFTCIYCATSTSATLLERSGWLTLEEITYEGENLVIFHKLL